MELDLADKAVLVVGATQGLGRATAIRLADEGAKLGLIARTESDLRELETLLEKNASDVAVWAIDAANTDQIRTTVAEAHARFGTIDGLVCAIGPNKPVGGRWSAADGQYYSITADDDLWSYHFNNVLMSAVRPCREVIPIMQAQGRGAIVNVAAISIKLWLPQMAPYSAMKSALAHFTKNLSREAARDGIRVNTVMPGFIHSPTVEGIIQTVMDERSVEHGEAFRILNEDILDGCTYSGRTGDPAEYADVITFLLSDRACYVMGAAINVDGGSAYPF